MKRLINVLIAQYLSCFTLNMCLCFSFRLWCHQREKRKQRYLIIAPPFIISAPSDSELSRVSYLFFLLNEDSIVHCVLWFFFFFQKARSESDCKVPPPLPADVRPLNPFAAVMQVLIKRQNFFSFCFVPECIHSKNHLYSERFFTVGCVFWIMWIRFIIRSTSHMQVHKIVICNTCCSWFLYISKKRRGEV